MIRRWRSLGTGALGCVLAAGSAVAAPTLITTRPAPEPGADALTFLVGGLDDGGRSLKASTLELSIDGQKSGATAAQPLSDWAASSAEASPTWRPPISVGLVYLWIDGVPAGVLDGIHAFFQRVPSRTVVYPTIYGRLRQGRARLTAADISRLDEVPYLDGYRPEMIDAVRLDVGDLAVDPAPLKLLVLVTDGRDFADPKGEGPGDFAALGARIRQAGITTLIVGFPPPEADAAQAAANLHDLHDAAGGFVRVLDAADDLENTLESLGQGVADLQRVEVPAPWTWRLFGGTHRVSVQLTAADGQRLTAEVGSVTVGAGTLRTIALIALALLLAAAAGAFLLLRRRSGGPAPASDDAIVAAVHDLIRRGASPQRAADELTRNYADAARALLDADEAFASDPRFPYLRTRPGRKRLHEIRDILNKKAGDRPALGDSLARALAEAVTARLPPDKAADSVSAHATAEDRTAFVALDLDQLAEALRAAARAHPALGSPRARGAVVAIQDALRSGENQASGAAVGWLVRAGGPGRLGETLRLSDTRTVIGQAGHCSLRIDVDPTIVPEHAEIAFEDGEFSIAPLAGGVRIEGQPVAGRQTLVDGETVDIGAGMYVFKSASIGSMASAPRARTRPRAARR